MIKAKAFISLVNGNSSHSLDKCIRFCICQQLQVRLSSRFCLQADFNKSKQTNKGFYFKPIEATQPSLPQQINHFEALDLIELAIVQKKILVLTKLMQMPADSLQNLLNAIFQCNHSSNSLVFLWKKIKILEILSQKAFNYFDYTKKFQVLLDNFCTTFKSQISHFRQILNIADQNEFQLQLSKNETVLWLFHKNLSFFDLLEATETLALSLKLLSLNNQVRTEAYSSSDLFQEGLINKVKLSYVQILIMLEHLGKDNKMNKFAQYLEVQYPSTKSSPRNIFQMKVKRLFNLFPNSFFQSGKQLRLIQYCATEINLYRKIDKFLQDKQVIYNAQACLVFLYRTGLIHNALILKNIMGKLINESADFRNLQQMLSLCNVLYLARKSNSQYFDCICGKIYKQIVKNIISNKKYLSLGQAKSYFFLNQQNIKEIIYQKASKVQERVDNNDMIKHFNDVRNILQVKYGVKLFRAFAVIIQKLEQRDKQILWSHFQSNKIVIKVLSKHIACVDLIFQLPKMYEFHGRRFPNSFNDLEKSMVRCQSSLKSILKYRRIKISDKTKRYQLMGNQQELIGNRNLDQRWWIFPRSFSVEQISAYAINNPDLSALMIFRFTNQYVEACLLSNPHVVVKSGIWEFPHYYDFVIHKSDEEAKKVYLSFKGRVHTRGMFQIVKKNHVSAQYNQYLRIMPSRYTKSLLDLQ